MTRITPFSSPLMLGFDTMEKTLERIAKGSGTQVPDINRLLKQHKQMQKMMKKVTKKGGMQKMMRGMQAMQNMKVPPGLPRR